MLITTGSNTLSSPSEIEKRQHLALGMVSRLAPVAPAFVQSFQAACSPSSSAAARTACAHQFFDVLDGGGLSCLSRREVQTLMHVCEDWIVGPSQTGIGCLSVFHSFALTLTLLPHCFRLNVPFRFIDVGCAQGVVCLAAAAVGFHVVGVDVIRERISIAKSLQRELAAEFPIQYLHCNGVDYLKGVGRSVIFCFDAVFSASDREAIATIAERSKSLLVSTATPANAVPLFSMQTGGSTNFKLTCFTFP